MPSSSQVWTSQQIAPQSQTLDTFYLQKEHGSTAYVCKVASDQTTRPVEQLMSLAMMHNTVFVEDGGGGVII